MTFGEGEPQGKVRTPGTGSRTVNGRQGPQKPEPGFGGLGWTQPSEVERTPSAPAAPRPDRQTPNRG